MKLNDSFISKGKKNKQITAETVESYQYTGY